MGFLLHGVARHEEKRQRPKIFLLIHGAARPRPQKSTFIPKYLSFQILLHLKRSELTNLASVLFKRITFLLNTCEPLFHSV